MDIAAMQKNNAFYTIDANNDVFGRPVAYNNFYFFATIPPVMAWNFTVNHLITWKHQDE